jgi:hypothetical protein
VLATHVNPAVLAMSECVLDWAIDHFQSLIASSEEKDDPSWPLAFGALYVPSQHVVSDALS